MQITRRRIAFSAVGLLVFGAASIYLSGRQNKLPSRPATEQTLPIKLNNRNPASAQLFKPTKQRPATFNGISPSSFMQPQSTSSNEIASTLSEVKHSLELYFTQMKDTTKPIFYDGESGVQIETDGVCINALDEEAGKSIALYDHSGELLGYAYISFGLESAIGYLRGNSYYGVLDLSRELIGFRQRVAFYSPSINYLSLSGKDAKINEDLTSGSNYIFGPQNGLPLGQLNSATGEIKNDKGETVGYLEKEEIYLPLYNIPNCQDENNEDQTQLTSFVVRFPSAEAFEEFLVSVEKQLNTLNQNQDSTQ
ncbi:MAG: hypothetical protein PHH14_03100 [Candidatus Margulisbacteria bacterium]|nr:hypothetical protein [Candidatus Margulisiibacteriota bacterium]